MPCSADMSGQEQGAVALCWIPLQSQLLANATGTVGVHLPAALDCHTWGSWGWQAWGQSLTQPGSGVLLVLTEEHS